MKTSLFFFVGVGLAIGLLLLLVLAPRLPAGPVPAAGWARTVDAFARDTTLRRTTFAAALGLLATACIFFRLRPKQSV